MSPWRAERAPGGPGFVRTAAEGASGAPGHVRIAAESPLAEPDMARRGGSGLRGLPDTSGSRRGVFPASLTRPDRG